MLRLLNTKSTLRLMTSSGAAVGRPLKTLIKREKHGIVVGCCVVVKDYDNDIVKEYLKCKK